MSPILISTIRWHCATLTHSHQNVDTKPNPNLLLPLVRLFMNVNRQIAQATECSLHSCKLYSHSHCASYCQNTSRYGANKAKYAMSQSNVATCYSSKGVLTWYIEEKSKWHSIKAMKVSVDTLVSIHYHLWYHFLHTLHGVYTSKATIVTKATTASKGILSNCHGDWSIVPVSW